MIELIDLTVLSIFVTEFVWRLVFPLEPRTIHRAQATSTRINLRTRSALRYRGHYLHVDICSHLKHVIRGYGLVV